MSSSLIINIKQLVNTREQTHLLRGPELADLPCLEGAWLLIEDDEIAGDNVFERITDLAGVRVLHLYQDQFQKIHKEILVKVESQLDWYLPESPKAYTWDPESKQFYERQNIQVEIKESFYTSVHYLVKQERIHPYAARSKYAHCLRKFGERLITRLTTLDPHPVYHVANNC